MSATSAQTRGPSASNRSQNSQTRVFQLGFTTLIHPPANPVADVVFIHGLQGHPEKTWTYAGGVSNGESVPESNQVHTSCCTFKKKPPMKGGKRQINGSVFWPRDLLPKDRNDVRLMTYGYDSDVTKFFNGAANQTNISEHGRSLLNSLSSQRFSCPRRPLIFVAHSLGGLLIKEALRRSRDERYHEHLKYAYRSTFAIIFFGTPHRGSGDAAWGEMLRRIASASQLDTSMPILADLDPSFGSAKLDELGAAFSNMLDERGFKIFSFQESLGKAGVKPLQKQVGKTVACSRRNLMMVQVVPKESSALNEWKYEIRDSINANHMNMCKFKGRDDAGYRKFLAALNLCVAEIHRKNN